MAFCVADKLSDYLTDFINKQKNNLTKYRRDYNVNIQRQLKKIIVTKNKQQQLILDMTSLPTCNNSQKVEDLSMILIFYFFGVVHEFCEDVNALNALNSYNNRIQNKVNLIKELINNA